MVVLLCNAVSRQGNGKPDPKLYLWDEELDTVQYFNFETGRGEQDDYSVQDELDTDISEAERSVKNCCVCLHGLATA